MQWHATAEDWVVENINSKSGFIERLESNKERIWNEMESKIKAFLTSGNLAKQFRFDNFIKLLNVISKLNDVGAEFTGVKCDTLQKSIHKQCLLYLDYYHDDKIEELKSFLMTETWTAMPLIDGFNLDSLHEFSFLSLRVAKAARKVSADSGYFENHGNNPFSAFGKTRNHSEKSDREKLKQDMDSSMIFSSVKQSKSKTALTNTVLGLLRLTGAYFSVAYAMPVIAHDVFVRLSQAVEFCIVSFVKTLLAKIPFTKVPQKLKTICYRHPEENFVDLNLSHTSTVLDLTSKESIPLLLVAGESILYLQTQFENLKSVIDKIFQLENNAELESTIGFLYEESVPALSSFIVPLYEIIATNSFHPVIATLVSGIHEGTNFDLAEIEVTQSAYVEVFIRKFTEFRSEILRLDIVDEYNFLSLEVLWKICSRQIFQVFMKGISKVEKCSNEGRAKMQLDFQQLLIKLESLTGLKFEQEASSIKEYVQTFYLTSDLELEDWIIDKKAQNQYTPDVMKGLVACYCTSNNLDKKIKKRLFDVVDS